MTTIDEFQLAVPIRIFNQLGEILDRLNINPGNLAPDVLISEASRRTELADWGEADFLNDYTFLISCVEGQPHLTLFGRLGMRREFLRVLVNRLQIQYLLRQHPEILAVPIHRPIFIVGLPRTGTTLLHKLMAQDNRMRVPPLWQLLAPFPLTSESHSIEGRIRQAEQFIGLARFTAPQMRILHPLDAHEPEECVFLLPHHLLYHLRAPVPDYKKWYLERNTVADYGYYRQLLQVLGWQQPIQHWVMKSPFHLFSLDTLLTVFPDACVVQTHRDLNRVLPSWCSFGAAVQKLHLKQSDYQAMGDEWLALWKIGIERTMSVRESAHPAQFFDLHYNEFITDPIGSLRQLYQYFNYELDGRTEAKMRQWLQNHSQEKHGSHRYTGEQFGLSEARIGDIFKAYTARFPIQPEQ